MTSRKLIDESGVTRMTLYQHFAGRENPIKEVLEQRQSFVVGNTAEKLGLMPDATTRLKGIFDRYGTWFYTPEFTGYLFEYTLAGFGDAWLEVTDVAVRYRDDLLAMMEALLKDVVPASAVCRLVGVYVMRLAGVTAGARVIDDPSAASQVRHAAEALLHQIRAATEAA